MQPIEIIVIVACVLIVGGVIVKAIIDKKNGRTSCGCDCANCSSCSACKNYNKKEKHTEK